MSTTGSGISILIFRGILTTSDGDTGRFLVSPVVLQVGLREGPGKIGTRYIVVKWIASQQEFEHIANKYM